MSAEPPNDSTSSRDLSPLARRRRCEPRRQTRRLTPVNPPVFADWGQAKRLSGSTSGFGGRRQNPKIGNIL